MEDLQDETMTYQDFDNWLVEQARTMPCLMLKGSNSKHQEAISNIISQHALGRQDQLFNQVDPTVQQIIAGGGMLPGQESALRAQTINQLPQQYEQLFGKLGQQLTARGLTGGQMAGGGEVARQFGSLGAQEAGQAQQGEFNIAGLKMQGLGSALNLGANMGNAYGSQGISANSTAASAANAADQASTGFWGSLFGALGAGTSLATPGGPLKSIFASGRAVPSSPVSTPTFTGGEGAVP